MTDKAQGAVVEVRCEQIWIVKGNESFRLAYEAESDAAANWYADRLRAALKAQPAPTEAQGKPVDAYGAFAKFKAWAADHLGQGYSLAMEDHTFIDPVTRWAFAGYRAGLRAAQGEESRPNTTIKNDETRMDTGFHPGRENLIMQGEDSARLDAERLPTMNPACGCQACNPQMIGRMMFICGMCGDKRCPHVANHVNPCQGRARASAETGGVKS